jgi:ABC-type metal ion transport system substrate-binding protein
VASRGDRDARAAQLPRALDDVAVAQVSPRYLVMSGGDRSSEVKAFILAH